jgi:hypothetical protein
MDTKLMAELTVILAKRNLRFSYREELIEWANRLLETGEDTRSLRILAGLQRDNQTEAEQYLRSTLLELAIT